MSTVVDGINYPEIHYEWKRPETIEFPKIWQRFKLKSKNGISQNVIIQDLTSNRYDDVCELLRNYFFPEEGVNRFARVVDDVVSLNAYLYMYRRYMEQNTSIIAILDEGSEKPKIVGFHILYVISKKDPPRPMLPGDAEKRKWPIINSRKDIDTYSIFDCDHLLKDWGLAVIPEYRGTGLGLKILQTSLQVAKEFDVPASAMTFTTAASQRLAEKAGFKDIVHIDCNEFVDDEGQTMEKVCGIKAVKLMGTRLN